MRAVKLFNLCYSTLNITVRNNSRRRYGGAKLELSAEIVINESNVLTIDTVSHCYKKLSYRRGTARCVVSIEILPVATQQCRNYLYDKS